MATQVQFTRVYNDKIYQARVDTFRSDERLYDVALEANTNCLISIDTRETYRALFSGVSELFRTTAGLPSLLFPESTNASTYRDALVENVEKLIDAPVEEKLPIKVASDCPQIPMPPTRPER